jgi:3D (Asp-Asp-Asp) domain-containing protein
MTTARYMTALLATAGLIATFPFFAEGQNGTQQNGMVSPTVVRGTGNGDGNGERISTGTRTFRVSAYCACAQCTSPELAAVTVESGQRRTASGYRLKPDGSDSGRICAAPAKYPFGTTVTIPGYGTARILDRGGAIKAAGERYRGEVLTHDRLDLYFASHQEARNFGIKYLTVTIQN